MIMYLSDHVYRIARGLGAWPLVMFCCMYLKFGEVTYRYMYMYFTLIVLLLFLFTVLLLFLFTVLLLFLFTVLLLFLFTVLLLFFVYRFIVVFVYRFIVVFVYRGYLTSGGNYNNQYSSSRYYNSPSYTTGYGGGMVTM